MKRRKESKCTAKPPGQGRLGVPGWALAGRRCRGRRRAGHAGQQRGRMDLRPGSLAEKKIRCFTALCEQCMAGTDWTAVVAVIKNFPRIEMMENEEGTSLWAPVACRLVSSCAASTASGWIGFSGPLVCIPRGTSAISHQQKCTNISRRITRSNLLAERSDTPRLAVPGAIGFHSAAL